MAPLQTSSAFPSPVEPSAIDIHHTTSSHWQSSLSTSTKGPGFINTPPFVASPPRPISCSPSGSEQDEIGSRLLVLCSIGKRPGSTPPTPILQTSSAQLYKRWIVYLGKDPDMGLYVHGIFINWQGGAAEYLKEGSKEHLIWRPFENVVIANEYYRECESTGIFKILRRPSNDFTHYIVQEGMHPGVYSSKTDLVTRGLRYRGGIVEVFIGTTLDAEDRYNQLIRQRKISTLSCIDISDDCM
ncbi:hypothetical protein VNI00_011049 [Paramarasmius palmivorus]|uniref:Uncharacterized protein n=1 Tax=Paramarasmius palmivorus TaxID=297713 RepID=A0AAW0CES5_9AGAR